MSKKYTRTVGISVFCYNPYWDDEPESESMWQPADVVLHGEPTQCMTCGVETENWMVTYVQGGPPAAMDDPDNVWFYECLPCALESSEGNILTSEVAEANGVMVTS